MAFQVEYLKFDFKPSSIVFNEIIYNELKSKINNYETIKSKELFSKYFKNNEYHKFPTELKITIYSVLFAIIVITGIVYYVMHKDYPNISSFTIDNIKPLLIFYVIIAFISGLFHSLYYYIIFIQDRDQYCYGFLNVVKKSNSYNECYSNLLSEWKK